MTSSNAKNITDTSRTHTLGFVIVRPLRSRECYPQ